MKTLRFKDGSPVPNEEVHYIPNPDARYRAASRERMKALREKLLKHISGSGRKPGKHPADQ